MIKSIFDICPSNGHLSLSDTSAAHFWHLTAEGKIAIKNAPFVMALAQTALTGTAPSIGEVISVRTLQ